jgi:hypothetical protein
MGIRARITVKMIAEELWRSCNLSGTRLIEQYDAINDRVLLRYDVGNGHVDHRIDCEDLEMPLKAFASRHIDPMVQEAFALLLDAPH